MIHPSPWAWRHALPAGGTVLVLLLAGCSDSDSEPPADAGPNIPACTSEQPTDQPPDEITYLTAFGNALGREGYAYVAAAQGFFAEQNLTVTIEPGEPRTNTAAVLAGEAHFAAVDSTGVLIRHGLGTETDTVLVSAAQQLPTISLISLDLAAPYELEGATIGAVEGPAITETMFPHYAQLAGIDESAVSWQHMGQPDLIPALVAGRVDAIALFLMSKATVAEAAGREAHVIAYDEYLPDLFGTGHIAARDLVEQSPDLVRRFNTAIMQGVECAIDDPALAGEIVAAAVPEADPAAVHAELETMAPYVRGALGPDDPLGAMDRPKMARALMLLQGLGVIPAGTTPDDVVAFDVVPGGGQR
jgi:NitT/TauT family transport system substrate-binding protein